MGEPNNRLERAKQQYQNLLINAGSIVVDSRDYGMMPAATARTSLDTSPLRNPRNLIENTKKLIQDPNYFTSQSSKIS
jgi:hypothetical protein